MNYYESAKDLIAQVEAKELTLEAALAKAHYLGLKAAEKEKCTIENLETNLKYSLDSAREEILESEYPEDLIREYVDSSICIYNSDLVEVLANDITLGFIENWDLLGNIEDVDVFKFLRCSIYERLSAVASEWLEANRSE